LLGAAPGKSGRAGGVIRGLNVLKRTLGGDGCPAS
jgi:hypothetical protein